MIECDISCEKVLIFFTVSEVVSAVTVKGDFVSYLLYTESRLSVQVIYALCMYFSMENRVLVWLTSNLSTLWFLLSLNKYYLRYATIFLVFVFFRESWTGIETFSVRKDWCWVLSKPRIYFDQ